MRIIFIFLHLMPTSLLFLIQKESFLTFGTLKTKRPRIKGQLMNLAIGNVHSIIKDNKKMSEVESNQVKDYD